MSLPPPLKKYYAEILLLTLHPITFPVSFRVLMCDFTHNFGISILSTMQAFSWGGLMHDFDDHMKGQGVKKKMLL